MKQRTKKPVDRYRASFKSNERFAEAAKRVRSRMAAHLAEAYPNGDYFDQPLYRQYFAHIIDMCNDIAEFRHFRGDGLPKTYFASRSRTTFAAEDLYRSFVTWIGGGLKFKHRFAEEEGAKWAAEAVRDEGRDAEIAVITELVWFYITEVDAGYVNRVSTPED